MPRAGLAALLVSALAGCGAADRARHIGQAPPLSAIKNPTAAAGYRPVQMPMPTPEAAVYSPNSLWRSGARAFFKDQRARQIGDILTITVNFNDKAKLDNETKRSRTSNEALGLDSVFGLQTKLAKALPTGFDPSKAVAANSTSSSDGTGSVNRNEQITTNVAAVVSQVLPNGNLVVEGRQEVRINFEVRELVIAGIVRPEDIGSDNTIDSSKIAEARFAYGGRGQITDVQQPRYGQQVLDILLPF